MCGVVAALGAGVTKKVWDAVELLKHRGIRSAVIETRYGAVGHVRLPIVGLAEEHDQPMQRLDGRYTIGFVGEVLDFREKYPTYECDAEFVADSWMEKGPWALNMHDGFWGIVVIDDTLSVLHVQTDYLGQKPMYYRTDVAAAASEPDALKVFGPVTLDEVYLSTVIKWGYCPDVQRTPYNEIKHVLPGEHIILHTYPGNSVFKRQIIDHVFPYANIPTLANLEHEIEAAVKRRVLSSDVPIACLVSGGVDSAIVYTLARRYGEVIPYHVSEYTYDDNEDYWNALAVINLQSTVSAQWCPPVTMEAPQRLYRCVWNEVTKEEALDIFQEPIDLGSLRPQVAMARVIPERVCLTGDGADELFGGYGRSMRYDSQYSDVFQELPAWHLPRLDRAMMRNRIEVRSPFLAREVVRMALALPHECRKDKNYLRSAFAPILPPRVAHAPKKALRTPEIVRDREAYSNTLIDLFRERHNATT